MIAYGYFCTCEYEDDAPQPEGFVYFSSPPNKGEKFMLPSTGYKEEWEVTGANHEQLTITAKEAK